MKIIDPHLLTALGGKEDSLENVAELVAEKIREHFRPWSGIRSGGVDGRTHVNRFGTLTEIISLFFQFDKVQAGAIASKIRADYPKELFHSGQLENSTEFRASLTTLWPQLREEASRNLPMKSEIANVICNSMLQGAIDLCRDQNLPFVHTFDQQSAPCFRGRQDSDLTVAQEAHSFPLKVLNASPAPQSMRLSRAGESFFYAGDSPGTCLAELRVPNGRAVTMGQFKFARPCQLVDFRPLERLKYQASLFQSDYAQLTQSTGILRGLISEFCQPSWSDDPPCKDSQQFDFYAPTQYFTAYMRTKFPKAEGVIYPSSQAKTGSWNIAFFGGCETLLATDPVLQFKECITVKSVSIEIKYEKVGIGISE